MLRHYYISDDLDDLEVIERELEIKGLTTPQLHVLSENDAEVEKHHLNAIEPVLKKDVVHSTELGAVVGIVASLILLSITYFMGWHTTEAGWLPFIFLSVVLLGFCTWEGGLIGIQIPNYQFKRFQKLLANGYHVFFVDVAPEQEKILSDVVERHPRLKVAGTGEATPSWVIRGQEKFQNVMKTTP
ncbi:NAD/FAD-utilizing enzyme [Aestuariibacter sp. AA17]|uniref:NAD/FAD-utilizing enzyme n=1 Tax=Fluctibacter corallii TaxID=2984329 RepID=A0ABT3A8F6_9ALTE|nr:NAD/FAD-utilizing enzyme [Aestuariibacter sp. AA17]MCV2884969.1 NAD/FAD-utilizing enzyme [Aestuariibacter sp. AA17]